MAREALIEVFAIDLSDFYVGIEAVEAVGRPLTTLRVHAVLRKLPGCTFPVDDAWAVVGPIDQAVQSELDTALAEALGRQDTVRLDLVSLTMLTT